MLQITTTKLTKETKAILAALAFILLYVSPLFLLGQNAHIRVHDNLDSNVTLQTVLRAKYSV
nr:DUF6044 family protein [Paenibacillus rhizovicinus]